MELELPEFFLAGSKKGERKMPNEMNLDDVMLNTDEAARFIGARASTMDMWRHRGRGPRYLKVGAMIKYKRSDFEAYLKLVTVEPAMT